MAHVALSLITFELGSTGAYYATVPRCWQLPGLLLLHFWENSLLKIDIAVATMLYTVRE